MQWVYRVILLSVGILGSLPSGPFVCSAIAAPASRSGRYVAVGQHPWSGKAEPGQGDGLAVPTQTLAESLLPESPSAEAAGSGSRRANPSCSRLLTMQPVAPWARGYRHLDSTKLTAAMQGSRLLAMTVAPVEAGSNSVATRFLGAMIAAGAERVGVSLFNDQFKILSQFSLDGITNNDSTAGQARPHVNRWHLAVQVEKNSAVLAVFDAFTSMVSVYDISNPARVVGVWRQSVAKTAEKLTFARFIRPDLLLMGQESGKIRLIRLTLKKSDPGATSFRELLEIWVRDGVPRDAFFSEDGRYLITVQTHSTLNTFHFDRTGEDPFLDAPSFSLWVRNLASAGGRTSGQISGVNPLMYELRESALALPTFEQPPSEPVLRLPDSALDPFSTPLLFADVRDLYQDGVSQIAIRGRGALPGEFYELRWALEGAFGRPRVPEFVDLKRSLWKVGSYGTWYDSEGRYVVVVDRNATSYSERTSGLSPRVTFFEDQNRSRKLAP